MVYNKIVELERLWPGFNREPYIPDRLLKIIESMGIIAIADKTIPEALAFNYKRRNFIYYNPHQTESDLVLTLGHEVGHFALGHVVPGASAICSDVFSKKLAEREAGIIGFLFWAPTLELLKMCHGNRLDIDELFQYSKYFDPDIDEQKALKLCTSRLSIFNGMRRVVRNKSYQRMTQMNLPGF